MFKFYDYYISFDITLITVSKIYLCFFILNNYLWLFQLIKIDISVLILKYHQKF